MNVLALDTSTEACSAAVLMNGALSERWEIAPRRHGELILSMVEAVLAEAGIGTAQLDTVAFGCGPGAFTGVRVAAAVAQGIAFAADVPAVPVSTLAALSRETMTRAEAAQVVAAIDARMGEVYMGAYRRQADGEPLLVAPERVCQPTEVGVPGPGRWVGAGSGWAAYGDVLGRRLGISRWWGECYPRAADIAMLGMLAYRRGETVSADQALPVYLRNRVVKEKK